MVGEFPNKDFWKDKKVFVTGHTGFKGSWLSVLLNQLGSEVYGYALEPDTNPSLYSLCKIDSDINSTIGDVRDCKALLEALNKSGASIVIHMAAQPLVRRSFKEPVYTFDTNIMGTVNVLEAIRNVNTVKSVVIVTTDKCYENKEQEIPYAENDPMGGYDPYSASKAACEIVTSSYRQSFFEKGNTHIGSARAGNVIGGGDWAEDRLIPDIIRSIEDNANVLIRYPKAIRPWQHVLEPLSGYLLLAQNLYMNGPEYSSAWNFGPFIDDSRDVEWVANRLIDRIETDIEVIIDKKDNPHETGTLRLDISKANKFLNWNPRWDIAKAIDSIAEFYLVYRNGGDIQTCMRNQISSYFKNEV